MTTFTGNDEEFALWISQRDARAAKQIALGQGTSMTHYNCSSEEMALKIAQRDKQALAEIAQGMYKPLKDYVPKSSRFMKV